MPSHRRTFIKQVGFGAAGLGLGTAFAENPVAASAVAKSLPRSTPESQGVASAQILKFLDALAQSDHEFHSLMIVRHGRVIAEGWWAPYGALLRHMLYSLSKSFTSTAVGFAVTEGRLSVDDRVTSFFPGELPKPVSENLASLKVKHLLTMSAGQAENSTSEMTKEQNWVKAFLALPMPEPPGSVFLYNSGATYMLSAIVQKLTGQRVQDYLTPRLFEPLEIRGITWETCPLGINTGGWGLSIRTEHIAKFGQFYLQKGVWNGRQLLPAAWIEEATTSKIQQPAGPGADLQTLKRTSDWHQGYCYQFWRCRHHAFRGDGAFGQYCIVLPDQDAVIAATSESADLQGELNLMWDYLLPAMKPAALPPDQESETRLRKRLASLALSPPRSRASSPVAARISNKRFRLQSNTLNIDSVTFSFRPHDCVFTVNDNQGEHAITCGIEQWVAGETDMPGTPPRLTVGKLGPMSKVAASGTWRDADTFEMTWQFYETPHHDTVTCRFAGDELQLNFLSSVTQKAPSHQETRPVLHGRMNA
jgi:CubicO group peptidase (beta-lactamase class C family)